MVVIIYPWEEDGEVGVASMFPNLSCGLTLEEIVAKDVPPNTPYKILDTSDLPSDPMFRPAWRYTE